MARKASASVNRRFAGREGRAPGTQAFRGGVGGAANLAVKHVS
jgi:hypothetical protein